MKVIEVLMNIALKDGNKYSCAWDRRFVKREFINIWNEGRGKSSNKLICTSTRCEECQNADSRLLIPLTKEQRDLNNV